MYDVRPSYSWQGCIHKTVVHRTSNIVHHMIDTHIHIWDFNKAEYLWLKGNTSILNRVYAIEELEPERKAAGITAGVLVQAANNSEDTDWMLETAEKTDWIKGVVGWLPLMDPAATEKEWKHKYSSNKYFKAVRHLIHDEADPRWLLQSSVVESLKLLAEWDLAYDVVGVRTEHIETVLEVKEKVPELRMVFDHLNQPPVSTKEKFGKWGSLIREASKHKNIYAKISGLGTASGNFSGWTKDDLKPYVEFVIDCFGVDRCFCGGDWPVALLAGSYTRTWSVYKEIINELVEDKDREKIFNNNAYAFYNL
jgi:L-fuconolactonase